MAQAGTVASLYLLRFKKGLLGSLVFTYFVCPEVFQPFKLKGSQLAEAEGQQPEGTERARRGAKETIDKAQRKGNEAAGWAKEKVDEYADSSRSSSRGRNSDGESTTEELKGQARRYAREVSDKYEDAKGQAKRYARDAKDKAEDYVPDREDVR